MLPGRLSLFATALAVTLVTSCAGVDGTDTGVIRENVIEPGITAMEDAAVLACSANAGALQTALDAYELLEGEPAPDEQALIDAGLLREPSDEWDVVDGELVPENAGCE